jgi:hypothetical protein
MKDAIWRDAPDAARGLYHAGALKDKVPPFQSVGGDDLTGMVMKRRVLLAIIVIQYHKRVMNSTASDWSRDA